MKTILPFEGKGNWYKGNLHCHSTVSDGRLEPEQLAAMYKEKGYSFLAFSEHEIFTNWAKFNTGDFIIIPAIERAVNLPGSRMCYHVHGILGPEAYSESSRNGPLQHGTRLSIPKWGGKHTVQEVIDEQRDSGNLVMLNHPVWSLNELDDILGLEGYFAMEIFNYGCEGENMTGLSTVYWDSLLKRGKKVWGIATDDNHNRNTYGEAPVEWDSFGGWVTVKAAELSQNSISDALLKGRFYSSSGPEIYDYGIKNGEAFVECSPVESIYFLTHEKRGYSRRNKNGGTISRATYNLDCGIKYIRIECRDRYGKTAWTNPIFL